MYFRVATVLALAVGFASASPDIRGAMEDKKDELGLSRKQAQTARFLSEEEVRPLVRQLQDDPEVPWIDCELDDFSTNGQKGLQLCFSGFLGADSGLNFGICAQGVQSCMLFVDVGDYYDEEQDYVLGIKVTTQCNNGFVGGQFSLAIQDIFADDTGLIFGAGIGTNAIPIITPDSLGSMFCGQIFAMFWDQDPQTFYKYQYLCQEGGAGKLTTTFKVSKVNVNSGLIQRFFCDPE